MINTIISEMVQGAGLSIIIAHLDDYPNLRNGAGCGTLNRNIEVSNKNDEMSNNNIEVSS
jgi:hypothetical protein